MPCGCGASVRLAYSKHCSQLVITASSLVHNHDLLPQDHGLFAKNRRLAAGEVEHVKSLLELQVKNKDARQFLQNKFGKRMTCQDIVNLRHRVLNNGHQVDDTDRLQDILNGVEQANGRVHLQNDEHGKIILVCFSTADMLNIGASLSEVLFVDGTYRVNKYGYPLYQIMIHDATGHGRCIMYSFLQSETRADIGNMFRVFLQFFPTCKEMSKVVFIDKDFKEIEAVTQIFGEGVEVLLCIFHVLKVFKKKISDLVLPIDAKRTLMSLMKMLVYAQSQSDMNSILIKVAECDSEFHAYVQGNWMNCVNMWAMWKRKNLHTLGNNTNNFVESENAKVKMDLTSVHTLSDAVSCLLRRNSDQEQNRSISIHRQVCYSVQYSNIPPDVNVLLALFTEAANKYITQHLLKGKVVTAEVSVDGVCTVRNGDKIYQVNLQSSENACSCSFYHNMRLPCRHIIEAARSQEVPLSDLVHVSSQRWHRSELRKPVSTSQSGAKEQVLLPKSDEVMTSSTKYNLASSLLHQMSFLLTECGTQVFSQRLIVLQKLVYYWQQDLSATVVSKNSSADSMTSINCCNTTTTALEPSLMVADCNPQVTSGFLSDMQPVASSTVSGNGRVKLFLPTVKVRGRPKRSRCWLNFNSKSKGGLPRKRRKVQTSGKKQEAEASLAADMFITAFHSVPGSRCSAESQPAAFALHDHDYQLGSVMHFETSTASNNSKSESDSRLSQQNITDNLLEVLKTLEQEASDGDEVICQSDDQTNYEICFNYDIDLMEETCVDGNIEQCSNEVIIETQLCSNEVEIETDVLFKTDVVLNTDVSTDNMTKNDMNATTVLPVLKSQTELTGRALQHVAKSRLKRSKNCPVDLSSEELDLIVNKNVWLTDRHVGAACQLLKQKFPAMGGLQDPVLGSKLLFSVCKDKFCQVLHDGGAHWLAVSNLYAPDGSIDVYDSMYSAVNVNSTMQAASIVLSEREYIEFRVKYFQRQTGSRDCGLFAIAAVTSLCHGKEPSMLLFDQTKLREHFVRCVREGQLTEFPVVSTNRKTTTTVVERKRVNLHCECRLPDNGQEKMAQCSTCKKWFHKSCLKIPEKVFENKKTARWHCLRCDA